MRSGRAFRRPYYADSRPPRRRLQESRRAPFKGHERRSTFPASRFGDPRYYQIAVLTGLLAYGTLVLRFDVRPWQIPLTLVVALFTQWACTQAVGAAGRSIPRSALISALSLCLLLRVDALCGRGGCGASWRSPASS